MVHFMTRRLAIRAAAALGLAALALAPAAAAPVDVLNAPNGAQAASQGAQASTSLVVGPYPTRAVVFVTASGESHHLNPAGADNAGIVVRILEGERELAFDDSFQQPSHSMTYRANAAYDFVLPRGRRAVIVARTDPYGAESASNAGTSVRMTLVVLAAN
jgi:hypothetical protein